MDDKLEVEPVRPQAEVPRTRIAAELANPIKKWSKVKGVIAIQALINDRRTSPLQKPVLPKEILVANDLITADMAGEEHDTPMSAEELELMHEIEELGDLIDKSNDVGGSRKIIEVLISEVLKHKKRIQELTAELEQDDDEYDELGLLMKADGIYIKLITAT